MNKLARISVICIGIVGGLAALFGLFYNATTLATALNGGFFELIKQQKLTHFYPAFYVMSCICIACYILLLMCCVDLLRLRFRGFWLLTGVLVFEVLYFISIAMCWRIPSVSMSVAAATGVANGGLMAQFLVLFPLWAPLVLWWARRTLERENLAA